MRVGVIAGAGWFSIGALLMVVTAWFVGVSSTANSGAVPIEELSDSVMLIR